MADWMHSTPQTDHSQHPKEVHQSLMEGRSVSECFNQIPTDSESDQHDSTAFTANSRGSIKPSTKHKKGERQREELEERCVELSRVQEEGSHREMYRRLDVVWQREWKKLQKEMKRKGEKKMEQQLRTLKQGMLPERAKTTSQQQPPTEEIQKEPDHLQTRRLVELEAESEEWSSTESEEEREERERLRQRGSSSHLKNDRQQMRNTENLSKPMKEEEKWIEEIVQRLAGMEAGGGTRGTPNKWETTGSSEIRRDLVISSYKKKARGDSIDNAEKDRTAHPKREREMERLRDTLRYEKNTTEMERLVEKERQQIERMRELERMREVKENDRKRERELEKDQTRLEEKLSQLSTNEGPMDMDTEQRERQREREKQLDEGIIELEKAEFEIYLEIYRQAWQQHKGNTQYKTAREITQEETFREIESTFREWRGRLKDLKKCVQERRQMIEEGEALRKNIEMGEELVRRCGPLDARLKDAARDRERDTVVGAENSDGGCSEFRRHSQREGEEKHEEAEELQTDMKPTRCKQEHKERGSVDAQTCRRRYQEQWQQNERGINEEIAKQEKQRNGQKTKEKQLETEKLKASRGQFDIGRESEMDKQSDMEEQYLERPKVAAKAQIQKNANLRAATGQTPECHSMNETETIKHLPQRKRPRPLYQPTVQATNIRKPRTRPIRNKSYIQSHHNPKHDIVKHLSVTEILPCTDFVKPNLAEVVNFKAKENNQENTVEPSRSERRNEPNLCQFLDIVTQRQGDSDGELEVDKAHMPPEREQQVNTEEHVLRGRQSPSQGPGLASEAREEEEVKQEDAGRISPPYLSADLKTWDEIPVFPSANEMTYEEIPLISSANEMAQEEIPFAPSVDEMAREEVLGDTVPTDVISDAVTEGGTARREKSIRRRILGWVNEKAKNYYQQKIYRTFVRETEEGDQAYQSWYMGSPVSRAERERQKRWALLKGELRRQRLEESLLKMEARKTEQKRKKKQAIVEEIDNTLWFCEDFPLIKKD